MVFEKKFNETESVGSYPFSKQIGGLEESERFPGAKIISFEIDGKIKRYSLTRGVDGELQGNEFEVQEYRAYSSTDGSWVSSSSLVKAVDGGDKVKVGDKDIDKHRIGPVYQMRAGDLEQMEKYLKEKRISI